MTDRTLLTREQLESSALVANCRMNRERELSGRNGYDRDLRMCPLSFLRDRLTAGRPARWLDLCCGTGRVLFQAAEQLPAASIVGVDLVGMFWSDRVPAGLRLVTASVLDYEPEGQADLITCVHGLHYVGDKLGVIARATGWLAEDGLFVANLDADNLRDAAGASLTRRIGAIFRAAGAEHDRRRRLVTCRGRRAMRFPLTYLGADDAAGPNYTGQPAVNSYYRTASAR